MSWFIAFTAGYFTFVCTHREIITLAHFNSNTYKYTQVQMLCSDISSLNHHNAIVVNYLVTCDLIEAKSTGIYTKIMVST